MRPLLSLLYGAGFALLVAGCDASTEATPPAPTALTYRVPEAPDATHAMARVAEDPDADLAAMLDDLNAALAESGAGYRAKKVEWVAGPDADEAGNEVIAKDVGNKQLSADFIPGDPRRTWSSGTGITYTIDQVDAEPFSHTVGFVQPGSSAPEATAGIQAAMDTWDGASCSTLPLIEVDDQGLDLGVFASIFGLGGATDAVIADVMHAGFTDINFSAGILGVAFTFVFTDDGVPTDADGDGQDDTAFREVYYDPSWIWADGNSGPSGNGSIDVQSIAVHEAGHALSQAHFGTVRIKNDGSLKASPRAVMNALYSGPFRDLAGTDLGGHCSNWGNWPNG